MSGFVRSRDEIEAIQERMAENRFVDATQVAIRFRTRESTVERILPPGLEPTEEPVIRADVVDVRRSNCVGSFRGGGIYVRARHDGHVGEYCLTMPMSTEAAITWGRELFGEPKKKAAVSLERDGSEVSGRVTRNGESIIEIDATLKTERQPEPSSQTVYHYKALPDATGRGFQFDPTLVRVTLNSDLNAYESGTGSLSLGSPDGPLGDLEIESVLGASYTEADLRTTQENVTTVDPESFLPYAYGTGRSNDWPELDNTSN
ncbi:acetoacetate decarboxylase family protein [Natrinema sp. 1APR25-10V2]|uniref:acetoacetate decarboxylase family protein n=1 Tax=Natrinema sp. 1APR25-10V2 TaxID=2951081 RepID=UPI002876D6B5|nr:acetoacetate decarboxylase family protein [Natrinema sp. 1APR25-10V2]MDS0476979.1 acetoacetate decarboxylase family protein [Natrinema sp. 1APR25-10V2]